jgi:hypothetical protein
MKLLVPPPEFLYNNRSKVSQNITLHHSFFFKKYSAKVFIKLCLQKCLQRITLELKVDKWLNF